MDEEERLCIPQLADTSLWLSPEGGYGTKCHRKSKARGTFSSDIVAIRRGHIYIFVSLKYT